MPNNIQSLYMLETIIIFKSVIFQLKTKPKNPLSLFKTIPIAWKNQSIIPDLTMPNVFLSECLRFNLSGSFIP